MTEKTIHFEGENQKPSYYSILTANVRYSNLINDFEKLLFSELTALSNAKGYATASNAYLAYVFGKSVRTVARALENLKEHGYVRSETIRNGKENVSRKLFVISEAEQASINEMSKKKDSDKNVKNSPKDADKNDSVKNDSVKNGTVNNTSIFNNTSNNNIKENKDNVTDKSDTPIPAKKKPNKRVYEEHEQPYKLARLLYLEIRKNNEYAKEPNYQTWANDIRLMHESDNVPYEVIGNCIVWCQNDSFWKSNILSASKLRKKFSTLYLQAKERKNKAGGYNEKFNERIEKTQESYDNIVF